MVIKYPNGQKFAPNLSEYSPKKLKNNSSFSNRGMTFEEMINDSNLFYNMKERAVIHKKPTPIQIVKVDYPRRSAAVIKEAYFKQASTTDYNGVYQGYYLDFEAKETKNKTSFPLSNIHQHQIDHMKQCQKQQGITFLLVYFSTLKNCYLLNCDDLFFWWDNKMQGKKSIPLSFFETQSIKVTTGFAPRIDYLAAVDDLMKIGVK